MVQKKLKTFHGEGAPFPVKVTGAHSFGSLIKVLEGRVWGLGFRV